MAKKGISYQLDGIQGVIKNLQDLDKRIQSAAMKSLLRKTANQMKDPLTSRAPSTLHGTFKRKSNISTVADREIKGAVKVGYNDKAYKARWIERGTKMRKARNGGSRGRITARPWIDKTHREEAPKLTKTLNENVTQWMVEILSRKSKSLQKKLNK